MNRRTYRVLCLFMITFFITSCSSLDFIASGAAPFKISVGKNSDRSENLESTADFYFWGNSPGHSTIDLQELSDKLGLEHPSFVSIEQTIGWKSFFYTIVTFGLYCPVDYKISLLTDKAPKE